jgi:hypothetical protein
VVYCVLNPDVTPATIRQTICVVGWTASIRPPSSYTSALKVEQLQQIGFADQNPADYEEDHRMPLELGGAPSDPRNLSPEAHSGTPNNSYTKDTAENLARSWVCNQGADLRQVQTDFIAMWLGPYPTYK